MTRKSETERKRDQRARAAAGQVHRVTVWLTEHEFEMATRTGSDAGEGLRVALWSRYAFPNTSKPPLDKPPQTAHNHAS